MSGRAVERFVALIRERTGNVVPVARRGFLGEVLSRRARAADLDPVAYVERLGGAHRHGGGGWGAEEWETLIPLVTIKESYFFRAPQQFAALERRLLPVVTGARSGERRLRVWSAACARGEEPGTLAILFAESPLLRGWDWSILATDVDEEALETARRGLYGERAVAHVPTAQLERWLRPRGKLYELAPELTRRIEYRRLNLARPPYSGLDESFDLIFLRNVLIYFPRPLQRRVVQAVADTLRDDGALFLGASETLWQIQQRLAAYDLGNCFCYRHRRPGEERGPLSLLDAVDGVEPGVSPPPDHDLVRRERPGAPDVPWLDYRGDGAAAERGPRADADAGEAVPGTGGQAGARPAGPPSPVEPGDGWRHSPGAGESGAGVADRAPGEAAPSPAMDGPSPPGAGLAEVLEAREDQDASHLHAEPCGIQERLLDVARRLEEGNLEVAAHDLEEVLRADPSEPAAHALDGFLHDLRREPDEAIQSYRAALYLDPALYQVRLLLADCMNRNGWQRRAEHEYREVLAALDTGRDRLLVPFEPLPVPDREGALRRCRRALGGIG